MHPIEQKAAENPSPWGQSHIDQYLASNGAEVEYPMADDLILLYTTGRKSGEIRRVPLVHYRDGEDLIVVASKGGAPTHPSWYLNLLADPRVWVRRQADFFEAEATVVQDGERETLWKSVTAWAPFFQGYQDKVSRQIPLVRLHPVGIGGVSLPPG
ncbi:MAG: nitroreductase family deazaflavin-dependent oxidoreductase [Acidimicrobiia bacterium]